MDAYSLGQLLRQAREDRELSLEDAKAKTRIPLYVLESFEQGMFQLADLSQVQVRGMLSNYATYLNLDPETVLNHYTIMLSAAGRRRRRSSDNGDRTGTRRPPTDPRRSPSEAARPASESRRPVGDPTHGSRPESFSARRERRRSRGRGFLNFLVIVTLALASFAVIALIVSELLQRAPDASIDTLPNDQGSGIADMPPTLTFTPPPSPTTIRTPTLFPRSEQTYTGEPVLVTVDFRQRAWVRMIVDGAELFAGLVRPGELTLEYRALNEIIVSSSNAEALAVTYNGRPQPSYGGRGQEVEVVFRPNNNITIQTGSGFAPTPEFSSTPRETPVPVAATLLAEETPSVTPGPSPTASNTFTPSPTLEFSPTASGTPSATATLTPSATATETLPPTETPPPSATPSPTAIVPPRVTPADSTPPKTP